MTRARLCRWIVTAFAVLYAVALGLLAIGTFGLLGQARDPLSGVFLLPLGLPWTLLGGAILTDPPPWLLVAAPLLNLLILAAACRRWRGV